MLTNRFISIVKLINCATLIVHLFAATAALSRDYSLKFERFTLEDGLPTSPAYAPVRDPNGFLWIGTWNGLYKYDGYTFKGFWHDPADSQSISHDWSVPFVDKDGTLWVGTRVGLDRFEPAGEKFERFRHNPDNPNAISKGSVDVIIDDENGNLWIGTSSGLNKYDPRTNHFTRFIYDPGDQNSLFGNQVTAIAADNSGNIWVGTGNPFSLDTTGCLNRLDEKTGNVQRYFVDPENRFHRKNFVRALWKSPEGDIWIGAWQGGLFRLPNGSDELQQLPAPQYHVDENRGDFHGITDFAGQPGSDYLWMTIYGGGLVRYNRKTFESDNFAFDPENPFSISENRAWRVAIDPSNTLWVGTHAGLNKVDISGKIPRFTLNFSSDESVTDILEDNSGVLWFGTSSMRLVRWDRKPNIINSFSPPKTNRRHWQIPGAAVAKSTNGLLWFANDCGLFSFDRQSNTFASLNNQFKLPEITSDQPLKIIEDNFDQIWFSSHPLTRLNVQTGEFRRYNYNPADTASLNNDDVDAIFKDQNGDIWIGTANGLAKYNRDTDDFSRFLVITDAQKTAVTGILTGDDAFVYVSTDTYGMIKLDPSTGQFGKFTVRNGMHTNTFFNILQDKSGAFWLFAASGATRFQPESGISKYFDQSDGLAEMQFSHNSAYRTRSGEFILGGKGAINLFDPSDYPGRTEPPEVKLTGLRISGERISPGADSPLKKPLSETQTIALDYSQNNLTFEFIATDYRNPQLNQFQFYLENYENDWGPAGNLHIARYTNLSPGEYIFRVKAANSDGVWNTTDASLEIVILKPWWQTWWAYFLYFFAMLAILFVVRKYEMNRIHLRNQLQMEQIEAEKFRELDQLKSRFFANISHEFRTPLTLIIGQINATIKEMNDESIKSKLQVAKRNSRRLLHLVNQLLDLSKLESGGMRIKTIRNDVLPFLKNLVYSFESLAEERGITLAFEIMQTEIICDYEPDKLEKIITNLLSNAFKFTPSGGTVSVSVENSQSDKMLEISVADTGIGISAERLPHIFERFYQVDDADNREYEGSGIGLALTKELVELFDGTISASSEKGKGTTFVVRLPLFQPGFKTTSEPETMEPQAVRDFTEHDFPAIDPANPEAVESAEIPSSETSILVIEDNADVRAYIRENLQKLYYVQEAVDGHQGLQIARETIPDLIISDVMMPRMDGFALSQNIRSDERTSHIPLILLTAKASDRDKIAGLQTGVDDYLIKPFNPEELLVRIDNLIKMRRKLRERFSTATVVRPSDVSVISADQQFLKRVLQIIEAEMGNELFAVDSLAAAVNMSDTQLNRKLNALINQPPGQLIRSMRLQRAADLLKQDAGNVAEICYQVGFSDQANFSRNFKKQFGVSPGQFKKQHSENG